MYKTVTLSKKIRLLLSLLGPILITQVTMSAMTFTNTVMSGRASTDDLAGVAIGSSIWVPVYTGLSGILLGLTPIISQMIGANKRKDIPFALIQAVYLAFSIAITVFLIGWGTMDLLLNHMGLTGHVRTIASHYLLALSAGIIPLFIYNAIRCFIDAHGQTKITMIITFTALPINILFNDLFIFGHLGFPRLGGVGAGVASAISYWVVMGMAILFVVKLQPFAGYRLFRRFYPLSLKAWKKLLKLGVPIGFSLFFETSIFSAVTLLMSQFSTIVIAAHQAAINFASLLYMMPFSMSLALTIAVSYEAGAKRFNDAMQYSFLGIGIAFTIGLLFAVGLFFFNQDIAFLYTRSEPVARMIQHFLLYAIFFQLSDAIAAPIQGALRGYKDVNVTFIMALVSYWVIGLPLGFILARFTAFGPFGYWIGFISGLGTGAVCLFSRLIVIQRKRKTAGGPT